MAQDLLLSVYKAQKNLLFIVCYLVFYRIHHYCLNQMFPEPLDLLNEDVFYPYCKINQIIIQNNILKIKGFYF